MDHHSLWCARLGTVCVLVLPVLQEICTVDVPCTVGAYMQGSNYRGGGVDAGDFPGTNYRHPWHYNSSTCVIPS